MCKASYDPSRTVPSTWFCPTNDNIGTFSGKGYECNLTQLSPLKSTSLDQTNSAQDCTNRLWESTSELIFFQRAPMYVFDKETSLNHLSHSKKGSWFATVNQECNQLSCWASKAAGLNPDSLGEGLSQQAL